MEQICTLLYNDWVPSEHNTILYRASVNMSSLSIECFSVCGLWTVNEAAIHLTENGGKIIFIFVLITLLPRLRL